MLKETSLGGPNVRFQKTLWTLVLGAQGGEHRTRALDQLVRMYWKPAYFYIRRRGHGIEDAKDLTQEFFAVFLEKDVIRAFSRERGRFRTFLLAALGHFLAKEVRRERAIKRGGLVGVLSLDFTAAEEQFAGPAADSAEAAFDREWALTLIQEALSHLRREAGEQGRSREFELLEPFVTKSDPPYGELAERAGSTAKRLSRDMYHLRTRLKAVLRSLVRETVMSEDDVRQEVAGLARIFRAEPGKTVT
ncbi:MAG: sigma-70 family RNA polymerase sigma factor [Planctomycetes bacterium]|nr:sigma-70 family RNA polymerase sigma factor [Planctomycetota bacterium]